MGSCLRYGCTTEEQKKVYIGKEENLAIKTLNYRNYINSIAYLLASNVDNDGFYIPSVITFKQRGKRYNEFSKLGNIINLMISYAREFSIENVSNLSCVYMILNMKMSLLDTVLDHYKYDDYKFDIFDGENIYHISTAEKAKLLDAIRKITEEIDLLNRYKEEVLGETIPAEKTEKERKREIY